MSRLTPHGPRGIMLAGFGVVALTFGDAYLLNPGSATSLAWITDKIPIQIFGMVWLLIGAWLVLAAFNVRQALPLAAHAGVCTLWAIFYGISSVIAFTSGKGLGPYLLVPLFAGLALASFAAVRMNNPAPSHPEVVIKPGPPRWKRRRRHG